MTSPRLVRSPLAAAGLLAAVLISAGCAAGEQGTASSPVPTPTDSESTPIEDAAAGATGTDLPVTVEHAFGETTVKTTPERVVTWGWGSTDAALALGTVPVAIPLASYGGNEDGVLPWVADALQDQQASTPILLPDVDGIPFEQIAAAQPDLILAVYSGITAQEYETLSAIAPTVAYPDQAWSTPWRDVVRTVGASLGVPDRAEEVLADTEAQVAAAAAAHPELRGQTVAAVADTPDAFYVYEAADPRVEFLTDLGMTVAPSVEQLSTGESTFFFTLSPELVGGLESDVLLSYADTPELAEEFLAKPYAQTLPQVQQGAVASVVGQDVVAAVSPPTALSLPWGLDTYVEELSEAALSAG